MGGLEIGQGSDQLLLLTERFSIAKFINVSLIPIYVDDLQLEWHQHGLLPSKHVVCLWPIFLKYTCDHLGLRGYPRTLADRDVSKSSSDSDSSIDVQHGSCTSFLQF